MSSVEPTSPAAATAAGYSLVAKDYAQQFYHELEHKPLDQALLKRLAVETLGKGPVCDMGCGPGEVARYLKDRGAEAIGMDLSAGMVIEAKRLNPDIPFSQGDMLHLNLADNSWAGIAAFYSLIHIPRAQVIDALRELRRLLKPGGVLLLSFHVGDQTVHLDEWWGHAVSIDFNFYLVAEMEGWLRKARFQHIETTQRDPYPEIEHQSKRAYMFAYK